MKPAPGLHPDIPAPDYHAWEAVSQSRLWTMRKSSPAHAFYALTHPMEATPAMLLGQAVHCAVLEPGRFGREYIRAIDGDGRTAAVKAARAAQSAENPAATLLTSTDFDKCLAIREACAGNKFARMLLDGDHESSFVWADPDTGLLCKGRSDVLGFKTGSVVDLKTTRSAARNQFERSLYQYGYHVQAAHYLAGVRACGIDIKSGEEGGGFVIIAVEPFPPYAIQVFRLLDPVVGWGEEERRKLLEKWAACEASGIWPGYPDDIQDLSLPPWATREIEEVISE
ncbi:MAG: PD-(D/E)XK nuclease-like domain-containing protein [bacterium]